MFLTVTYVPDKGAEVSARVLGYLLHKHPDKRQTFSLPVGEAHVFYPEATDSRATIALLLEIDSLALARNKRFRGDVGSLGHYINDRPYASSSMLSVALGSLFRTAMTGRSDSYPELAANPLSLSIHIPVLSTRGDEENLVRRLFEPCGWQVAEDQVQTDIEHPEWGPSRYSVVTLSGQVRLAEALRQLYVLLPVLDDSKHYWVGDDEVAKLQRAGEGWLSEHPERELITRRYLLHQRDLVAGAAADGAGASADGAGQVSGFAGTEREHATPLRQHRTDAVLATLRDIGAHQVVDMGCGGGALLRRLVRDGSFTKIVGVDVSPRSLERAARVLNLAEASDAARERVQLLHGSVLYRDQRLVGMDAMVLMEVIEHVDFSRLASLEDSVFGHARPEAVIVTTPNSEYNALYPGLASGEFRHPDHRFEFTRAEFAQWAERVAAQFGYRVDIRPVGEVDATHGAASQLALFQRKVQQ